jgi:type IV secretory pathway TraG/TraD family ATPase VirD4
MSFSFHLKHIREICGSARDFSKAAKVADAYLNFPRPAIEQHLSSDKAARHYLAAHSRVVGAALFTALNLYLVYTAHRLVPAPLLSWWTGYLYILAVLCFVVLLIVYYQAWSPYFKFRRRESAGASHWATLSDLRARKMLFPREAKVTPTHLPVAYIGRNHMIALPADQVREHMVFFGPPGCGKSASFFIQQARDFSDIGAGIFLDTKGEIYRYSAHYFSNVYRIDLERPEYSDRIDLLSFCRPNPDHPGEDAKMAGEIASLMIGFDPNNPKGGENPFWPLSATSMLKCFLLYLAERFEHVQPADIFGVLAALSKQAEAEARRNPKNPPPHPLHRAFMSATNKEVRSEWSPLSTLDEKTLGNIVISMTTPIASFRDPAVQTVLSPPSNEERQRGCRLIDFRDLRRRGTAIFVVVPEGQASRLAAVVGTVFGVAMNVLRRTGDAPGRCDTLVQLDEAGNVFQRNLREDIGVGRGRGIAFSLGYQSKNQPKTQYGADYAESFLQSCSLKGALPGTTGETAKWFSEMCGKTTTFKHTINDVSADALDSDRWDETSRDLMEPDAFRQLERHKQCVLIINQAPPILARIPPNAKETDPRESIPKKFVWNEEDLRKAKQDEMARSRFFEHARALPPLPRSPYELPHDIAVGPTPTFDPARAAWTTADLQMAARRREIEEFAGRIPKVAPTADEVIGARTEVAARVDAFSLAPEGDDAAEQGAPEAVLPAGEGGTSKRLPSRSQGQVGVGTGAPVPPETAGAPKAGKHDGVHAPEVERARPADVVRDGRVMRPVTPERIAKAIAGTSAPQQPPSGNAGALPHAAPSELPMAGDYHIDPPE